MNTSDHDDDERHGDAALSSMLKRAFDDSPPKRSLLPGIQERIRLHSRGRYFRKKSNPLRSPTVALLGAACFLLVLGAVLYAVVAPMLNAAR